MRLLDLTLPEPADNLACDEALLDYCEAEGREGVLRFWEPRQYFVVLGYANKVREEVNLEACQARQTAIYRRCSGGGSVLQGPGCLNYTLVLEIDSAGPLQGITSTNAFVMERNCAALAPLLDRPITVEGFTDLASAALKFSGNSQRRKRNWLLFHGTFLLEFDVALMDALLLPPPRPPAYRRRRRHSAFVTCLHRPAEVIKAALRQAWHATEPLEKPPWARIEELADTKYRSAEWNLRW